MFHLQSYKLVLKNCGNKNVCVEEKSQDSDFLHKLKIKFLTNCGQHTWHEAVINNSPIWVLLEITHEEPKVLSFYAETQDLVFGINRKYKLLRIYDFHPNEEDSRENHFRGIFLLNSKQYLIDDLMRMLLKIDENFILSANCMIYYKVNQ